MNVTNMTMVERGCADCLLRALNLSPAREPDEYSRPVDTETALERQLEQIERGFGRNWKW